MALSAPYKGLWGVGKSDLGVGQGGINYPQALSHNALRSTAVHFIAWMHAALYTIQI